ncbi:MAG: tol-pal system protein YbgF [Betaproteobacteria bacterium]|nr:tol-pal system protein YbgF [Betaproteobacteria bacterium]
MEHRLRVAVALLAASFCMNAVAGIFDEDARREVKELRGELEKRDRDVDSRILKLDESLKNIGIIQLLNQIEQLNAEISKLRGQIEVLANQNEQLTKRQKDFYLDIDSRLRKLEGLPADGAPGAASPGGTVVPAPAAAQTGAVIVPGPTAGAAGAPTAAPVSAASRDQELRAYDVGSNLFKRGDYLAATRAFQIFMKDFPSSGLVPNAQYWIGISYFNLRDYANARSSQETLLKLYPDSSKVPDAMLAIASVMIESGDNGSARNTLEDIIARFPASDAAGKARTRLAQLRR